MFTQPTQLNPAGTDLFKGFGELVQELSEADEAIIAGGDGFDRRSRRRSRRSRRRSRRRRTRIFD